MLWCKYACSIQLEKNMKTNQLHITLHTSKESKRFVVVRRVNIAIRQRASVKYVLLLHHIVVIRQILIVFYKIGITLFSFYNFAKCWPILIQIILLCSPRKERKTLSLCGCRRKTVWTQDVNISHWWRFVMCYFGRVDSLTVCWLIKMSIMCYNA